jgi:prevent-host-death family protein
MAYTVHQAKTQLSKLIEEACNGEEVIIARGKKPVVKLVPLESAKESRVLGFLKGKIHLGAEFFEPLPEEEMSSWEGR